MYIYSLTDDSIHERSADEKLQTSKVAHGKLPTPLTSVLNDEVSRKYIQSLKRLMTFAQSHVRLRVELTWQYPPDDLSKLMG